MSKKILIITRNLPPLIGGMERLNWHIADELSKDNDIILLSHSEAKLMAPSNCDFHGVRLNPLPIFLIIVFIKTFILCLQKKPDILFAGSGLIAPITTFWAKIFRKKSIVYIHGLDIATNHWIYNLIWVPMIRNANIIIANSTPTYDICLKKAILKDKLSIVYPGVTYPPLPRNQHLINSIKAKHQLHDKKILISVGRLTQRKGLNEFVDLALPLIVAKHPNTILIVIGDTPSQSLNQNLQSRESILKTAQKHNLSNHILFLGNISDDLILSSWYYLADIHVFPVKHIPEDPEGFGMVAIEAAAHGTPTVAFATGGIVDAVENLATGRLIPINQYHSFSEAVISMLQNSKNLTNDNCEAFAEKFSWKNLKNRLNSLILDSKN
ncbi:glycosyltransferase family 1 protein [Acinetobacter cumulans]|uniref:Glycosyltransferase family 1 protein n=1 Tax=Acinetobacter cumulans TaxID=2136182 RepID=A0A498D004_9GAMM|nr:glycosyltransferase family 4 protein [Acinetobacter cumulans]RLL38312.1 glycosyltransferase family 1 protein [Acinetobacter cumulans]